MTPEESEYMIYRGWGGDALPQSNVAPIPLYHLTGLKNHWGHGLAVRSFDPLYLQCLSF